MTDTTVATATLEHLDPNDLLLTANIRELPTAGPEFIANVSALGVLEPIVGWRTPDGVAVKFGQRRTIAARAGGLTSVPVYVHESEPETADRIVTQWAENEQREALTGKDKVGAVEQLALIGWKPDQIATSLDVDPEDVTLALKVAKSEYAKDSAGHAGITLEYAALLAEFEDDAKAVERILDAAAEEYPPEHLAEQLRSAREEADELARVTAELAGQGITVVEQTYPAPHEITRLGNLKADADATETLTVETHQDCTRKGAYVSVRRSWAHSRDPEANPDKWDTTVTHVCLGWPAAGHVVARPAALMSDTGEKKKAAEMTDAERETAKAERRHVIESNKAWREAAPVRLEWLGKFGGRKEAPAGAEKVVGSHLTGWIGTNSTNLPIVGLDRGKVTAELGRTNTSAKRALHLVTCIVVASIEDHLNDDAWRTQLATAGPYLETLGKWGYPLADIEKRIVVDAKAAAKPKRTPKVKATADAVVTVKTGRVVESVEPL